LAKRKKTSDKAQVEILIKSRRRCCLCFGLNRDLEIKQGQIAHIDGDSQNNNNENLVFLCLDHHDQLDSKTSQSKGLKPEEVKQYRNELYLYSEDWGFENNRENFLRYLAAQVDIEHMAKSAVRIASRFTRHAESTAIEALTQAELEYIDGDLYIPLLGVLEYFQNWGWLSFKEEMKKSTYDELEACFINVKHKPICREIAKKIETLKGDKA
jgi:hypothetical protein